MERVIVDEDFQRLAEQFDSDEIYEIINRFNQVQQEMKWTNHPKIILEVCFVQLCQANFRNQQGAVSSDLITQLQEKIAYLEDQIQQLQAQGISEGQTSEESNNKQKQTKTVKHTFKAPVGKIENVLANATKQNLQQIKNNWGSILENLKKSHAALLNDAEPVAASSQGCVIKFKYEIHCQMAINNGEFISTLTSLLQKVTGDPIEVIGVPENQWLEIRQSFLNEHRDLVKDQKKSDNSSDPLIDEAIKLFGEDLLEIRD